MTRVAVTGGSGKLGRAVIALLLEQGYEVMNLDIAPPPIPTRQLTRLDPELKVIGLRFSNVLDETDYLNFPSYNDDITLRDWNLWSYIDYRDGASAVLKALEYDQTGFDKFVIAAADTVMSRSSASLAAERFPNVEVRKELGEHETLMSSAKAERVLGWTPEHSWRDA